MVYFLEKNNYILSNSCVIWFNENISKISKDKIIAGASIRVFSSSVLIYYKDIDKESDIDFITLYFGDKNKPIKIKKFQGGK